MSYNYVSQILYGCITTRILYISISTGIIVRIPSYKYKNNCKILI